ncbi:type I secretion system permease/ATPase [Brevundimonas sp.]|uniref:type I secretion system permease/ATPase n=1 Tax=Brevundimonas sp. TaxID=1871086 RepID=UPI0028ACF02B|nr:type I secretion system permease/ATPase [Brevundimonas sp.]
MFGSLSLRQRGAEPLATAVRECRSHLVAAAVFSALVNVLYLTPTLYMMQVYDRVVPTGGLTTLVLISAAALLALASLAGLDWLRGRILARAGLSLDRALTRPILSRVVESDGGTPSAQSLREFDSVRAAVGGQGMMALMDAPWTPIYLVCCFLLHWSIGALTLIGGSVLVLLAWLNERDSRPRLNRAHRASASAYSAQEAIAAQAEVVRALGMRTASIERQARQREAAVDHQFDAQLTGGKYSAAIKFIRLALQSAALGTAAVLVVKGQISAGSIIASSVLLSRAVSPIEQLVGSWPTLVQARTSWAGLIDLFVRTADVDRVRTALPPPKGRVQLENGVVRHAGASAPQLKAVSLRVEPGETLAVIGPSGSGKTTLARVLAGAIRPTAGTARLDGADYEAWSSDILARHIGYLPQNPSLFAGTIRDNIARFSGADQERHAVDASVVDAAKAAGAHDMILRLPEGYDTELGPFGAGVSAGQAQRVALARALFGDPALIVLDEPNSNLDQEGEAALTASLRGVAARGAAVVIVAHRAGVLAGVDRLLVMRDGAVHLDGPREEVLAKVRGVSIPTSIRGAA